MSIQLYALYRNVKLPDHASPIANSTNHRVVRRSYESFSLLRWPDGRLCLLATHWMQSKLQRCGGRDTPNTYSAQITPLIRFCYSKGLSFHEMTDELFYEFTNQLKWEKRLGKNGIESKRTNNSSIQVQSRALDLIEWISQSFPDSIGKGLIGETSHYKIIIEWRVNRYTGKRYAWHRHMIESGSDKFDKAPMPEDFIDSIRNEIFKKHDIENLPNSSKLKLKHHSDLYHAQNTYIYERRMFTIRLMKLMGLRPEELIDIPLDLNQDVLSRKHIAAPTKKRGRPAPIRNFPITLRAALDFNRYLKARSTFLHQLSDIRAAKPSQDHFALPEHCNALLLSIDGTPLQKQSLTKEFDRICTDAGLGTVRTCLSMFRHRFITREIHYLLDVAFAKDAKLKIHWTEALRDSICAEVMPKTGQANERSLWHYFHYEYELMTQTTGYVKSVENRDRLEAAQESLLNLKFDSILLSNAPMTDRIQELEDIIGALQAELLSGLPPGAL